MRRSSRTPVLQLLVLALSSSCAAEVDVKGEEDSGPIDDGSFDSFASSTLNGMLEFGSPHTAAFTSSARFHAWDFELEAPAVVTLDVGPVSDGDPELDTVMYLYRQGSTGWGRYIARNDDARGTRWSGLEHLALSAGTYRVLVKGFRTSVRGDFALTASCEGDGCLQQECTTFALERESLGDELLEAIDIYRDSCDPLFGCLNEVRAYRYGTCAALDLQTIVESVLSGEPDFEGFSSGESLRGSGVGDAELFLVNAGGNDLVSAVFDAGGGHDGASGWVHTSSLSCTGGCTAYRQRVVVWFPETGFVVSLDGEYGSED